MKFFVCLTLALSSLSASASILPQILPPAESFQPDQQSFLRKGISEETFNEILQFFESLYKDEVKALGGELSIDGEWSRGETGAFAMRYSGKWTVTVYGGLARHHAMTVDGLAHVVCHELGHHLGGAPKKEEVLWKSWTSVEGQADYYASAKCIERYIENIGKTFPDSNRYPATPFMKKSCDLAIKNGKSYSSNQICIRALKAAFAAEEMVRLSLGYEKISFETPDTSTISKTDEKHPKPQCRLDTLLNAALCPIDSHEEFDDDDHKVGSCHQLYFPEHKRPSCWFKAEN